LSRMPSAGVTGFKDIDDFKVQRWPDGTFHDMRATDTDDAIDRFAAKRRVQANAVSISSWDPAQLLAPSAEQTSNLDTGELPTLAIYDGSGERIASGEDAGAAADPHSRLMLQALELDNKLFEGAGAVRRLAAGHKLTGTTPSGVTDEGFLQPKTTVYPIY